MKNPAEQTDHITEHDEIDAFVEHMNEAINQVTDDVRRSIPPECTWPFSDQERQMMRDAGYYFE